MTDLRCRQVVTHHFAVPACKIEVDNAQALTIECYDGRANVVVERFTSSFACKVECARPHIRTEDINPADGLSRWPVLSELLTFQMIKIISNVVIAFCYKKANILRRWSNIPRIFYGNKGLCHCCRSYEGLRLYCVSWTCLVAPMGLAVWIKHLYSFRWKLELLQVAFEQLQY